MKQNMKESLSGIKKAVSISIVMVVICGLGYPLLLTGLAQVFFPHQANGSLIEVENTVVGSELVGQNFTKDYFMKSRPSAVNYNTYTQEQLDSGDYSGISSGSNNFAPSNPDLVARVVSDMKVFLKNNPSLTKKDIPTDLLTASGSGLDPHITPQSAEIQLIKLSETTNLSVDTLKEIVANNTEKKVFGILGENRVNVLGVNVDISKEMAISKN